MLVRDHVANPDIGLFCMVLRSQSFDRAAPAILRQVLDKNPHKQAQATAAFALAKLLRMRADWVGFFKKSEAKQRAAFEKGYAKEAIAELQHGDPEALRKESEMLLERLVTDKDYKNAETLYREKKVKLSELADRELFELRHLLPGKPAPEIAGEDIDGKAFKLSDYRGKVVLLDFWGHW